MFRKLSIFLCSLVCATVAVAQPGLTLPPSGDNQKASVSQWIGPVEVNVTYNSPDVTGPNGEDRTGQIWGQLVPWGMANLGFGTCGDQCPWRAGANENTVFTVSHDVLVEGQPLAAGSYGLHMLPGESEWTVIFSKDASSWGSFFYDASRDALRVTVEPEEHPFTHWLTYEFTDRRPDRTTVAMQWEKLQVPFTVEVPGITDLYLTSLERDLRGSAGFQWQSWNAAAQYAITQERGEPALRFAQQAVSAPFVGQENFTTLATLAQAQTLVGSEEARATLERAMSHPTADPIQIHQLGRLRLAAGDADGAMEIFERNAELHPDTWPVHVGLMRGYSAQGRYDQALVHAEKALANAPDDLNRNNLERLIGLLKEGKDVN